jgi:hypothetical protein
MGLQSVSQPIGKIINLRRESTTPGGTGWYVNGVEWTGAIKTIGASGKDYTNLYNAVYANKLIDTLYLIDPGTYVEPAPVYGSSGITIVRGLGTDATETVIQINFNGACHSPGWISTVSDNRILENVTIRSSEIEARMTLSGHDTTTDGGTPSYTINKCILGYPPPVVGLPPDMGIYSSAVGSFGSTAGNMHYYITNTTLHMGTGGFNASHLYIMNLANVHLRTVAFTQTWKTWACINDLAENDKNQDGTSGYGYGYGEFLVTNGPASGDVLSISQPIGDIIRLRRNENNIPADASGNTISQLIAQTGIRLRRNSSNVPGD